MPASLGIVTAGAGVLSLPQGWRGNVKAKHFIMALKDYYLEKAAGDSAGGLANADKWALNYITISNARAILEAFDGDTSGFLTIQEVNDFTCARPSDWRWVCTNAHTIQSLNGL